MMATGGSTSSQTKKTPIRSDPITNSGRAMAASAPIEIAWSSGLPAKTADSAPSARESGIMRSAVTVARMREFLTGSAIRSQTGAFSAPWASPTDESPRSPWTNPPSQVAYCSRSGRSSPSSRSSCCTASGVAPRPRTTLAASPGRIEVAAKMTTEAMKSAKTAPAKRRPRKPTTGGTSRASPRRSATEVMSRGQPCVHEQVVAQNAGGVWLESLHLVREPVHPVRIRPVEIATFVVLDLLHLVPVGLRLGLVELADRLLQRVVPRLVAPVRFVIRRARREGLQVEELERRDGPLGLGKRHLQVEQRRVVIRIRRDLLQLDRHAGLLRLLLEERRRLDEARKDRRGAKQDGQVLLASIPEQALRLVDVLFALRQFVVVEGKALADDVVADRPEAVDSAIHECLSVCDQSDRLAHLVVGEGRLGRVHVEHHRLGRFGGQNRDVAGALMGLRFCGGELCHAVDL